MTDAPLDLRLERRRHPAAAPAAQTRFAHPSERIFASLLDLYGIAWDYEPVEFTLTWRDDGARASGFRPDFWLPEQRCFVELTTAEQRLVTRKNAKIRRFRELYPDLAIEVVYQREFFALAARHGIDTGEMSAA
jgi:hypothetical protein